MRYLDSAVREPKHPQPDQPARRWISVEEAGAILGVGRARAYQLVREGLLPTLRISERRLLVPLRALDELEDILIELARQLATRRTGGKGLDATDGTGPPLALTPRRARRRANLGRKGK